MSLKQLAQDNKKIFPVLTLAAILPFVATSVIVSFILKYQEQMMAFSMGQWMLFYLAASLCMALAFTHTTFIALLSGFFLGWNSIIYVVASYLLALIIGYALAKKLDKGKFMQSLAEMPKAKIIAEELKANELKIIILSRLSPVLPFALMNLLLSLLKADLKKYLLGGFSGMLPRTLLFVWTGSEARNLVEALQKGAKGDFSGFLVVFLLIFSLLGLFYYILKATRKAKNRS